MGTSVVIADDLSRTDLQRTDLLSGDSLRKNRHCPRRAAERSRLLATLASQALIAEAELAPKPGLVDRRGSGAHSDLSLDLMRRSASVIVPYFAAMGAAAQLMPFSQALRTEVAAIGRAAESAMLQVTGGSNSHKGAIWILGLLVT